MNWSFDIIQNIVVPVLDVLLMAFLLYRSYRILVQTRAVQLVKGALMIVVIYAVAFIFNLQTVLWILSMMFPGLVIGVAIIFQPELRRIFTRIGQGDWFRPGQTSHSFDIAIILNTVEILSEKRRGALVVFSRKVGLKTYIDSGTRLDAELSSALLLSIFGHDTPLHDGAVVVDRNRVVAASCYLPLSEQPDIRRSFGTRHRAALGLAEETDAVILVVSEESGAISIAVDGNLFYNLSIGEAENRLRAMLRLELPAGKAEEDKLSEG